MKIGVGKIVFAGVILVLGAVLGMGVMTLRSRDVPAPIKIIPPEATGTPHATVTPAPILVYVTGEVVAPDVYALAPESRIKQLVEAAGGFTAAADSTAINLALPLVDGAHVHVPAQGDVNAPPVSGLTAPEPQQTGSENDLGSGGKRININTANLQELVTLPGIGPVTAQKILDYRQANGPFSTVEAIKEVSGIGPVKFDQIKQLITIQK